MANDTYLQEIITYPYRVLNLISEDNYCVGLIRNVAPDKVTVDDKDFVFERNLFSYPYIDSTVTEADTFVWAEIDIPHVQNKQIKNVGLCVTIACSKSIMALDRKLFPGQNGTRLDTLACHIDKLLSFNHDFGIGELLLKNVGEIWRTDKFALRQLVYDVPNFNYRDIGK